MGRVELSFLKTVGLRGRLELSEESPCHGHKGRKERGAVSCQLVRTTSVVTNWVGTGRVGTGRRL